MITGESGTGKELVAEALHHSGDRRHATAGQGQLHALMDSLLESELFGHVRGAFTGAIKDKVGRFEKANGGTLFLDEIGDISPLLQAKLLRVLQEKEFERVGDSNPIRVNVRIIAATNQDLLAKVKKGEFRQDLYYRLKVVSIHLPPLRERLERYSSAHRFFREQFAARLGKKIDGVTPEVLERFSRPFLAGKYPRTGACHRACLHSCHGPLPYSEHLAAEIRQSVPAPVLPTDVDSILPAFQQALTAAGGNKAKAARLLGISRKTLYRRLRDLRQARAEIRSGTLTCVTVTHVWRVTSVSGPCSKDKFNQ